MKTRLRDNLLPILFLVAVTVAIYGRILGHEFLINWDDNLYVTENETVRGLTWPHLRDAFSHFYVGNYAPVQMLSYMLDYTLWGLRPAGFLLTNILCHLTSGIVFYLLLLRLHGSRLAALTAASVFLCHPVQVESVAWVSERKNLLAMVFFLVSLYGYALYREREPGRGCGAYGVSLGAFVLALLAKSIVVILPPLLIIYDRCCFRSSRPRGWFDKLPYLVAAVAVAWLALISQGTGMHGGRTGYHGGTPLATLFTMMPVLGRYLQLLVWPTNLSLIYNPPIRTGPDATVLLAAGLLVILAAGGVYLYCRHRRAFIWYALFFLGLAPVSQIVPLVTLMNDRYLYFPLLGAGALVGLGVAGLTARVGEVGRKALLVGCCLVLASMSFLSWQRAGVWRNSLTLWEDTAAKTPEKPGSLNGLAQALLHDGKPDKAMTIFQQSLAIDPYNAEAWTGVGEIHQRAGRLDAAQDAYERGITAEPDNPDILNNLGILLMDRNELGQSRGYLERLIRSYPDSARGHYNLGNNYSLAGMPDKAAQEYMIALQLRPEYGNALAAMVSLSLKQRRFTDARRYYGQLARVGEVDADTEYNMACVEALDDQPAAALVHLGVALQRGYRDRTNLARDTDLSRLRTLPEFVQLMARYPKMSDRK